MASPKITVDILSNDHVSEAFQVVSGSFGDNAPFVSAYFPNHATAYGREQGAQRFLAWKNSSPESVFLKAVMVDGLAKKIIGVAIWTHMTTAPPAELEDIGEDLESVWPDAGDRDFMRALWRNYVKPRTSSILASGGHGVYVLELLAVHPEHQRPGAGRSLVEWGTRRADQQGFAAVVESTPVARQLYERSGLKTQIERMAFDIADQFTERRKPELTYLTRVAKQRA